MIFFPRNPKETKYLKKPCSTVTFEKGISICKMMERWLNGNPGKAFGVAANQFGYRWNCFIAMNPNEYYNSSKSKRKTSDGIHYYYFINPIITELPPYKGSAMKESCISLPGRVFMVRRFPRIVIEYDATPYERISINATGNFSRVIQHEMDHTYGVTLDEIAEREISKRFVCDKSRSSYLCADNRGNNERA